jgi:hypothetical protein
MLNRISLYLISMCAFVLISCNKAASSDLVYNAFESSAASNGIKLSQYSGYSVDYVNSRARLFCQLMDSGEMVKLSTQLNFGDTPGGLLSKPDTGGVLQKIIWRSATPILCPQHNQYLRQ